MSVDRGAFIATDAGKETRERQRWEGSPRDSARQGRSAERGERGENARLASKAERAQHSGMAETQTLEATALLMTGHEGAARRREAALRDIATEGISKSEACRRHGLHHAALTPSAIAPVLARSPVLAGISLVNTTMGDMWSITVETGKGGKKRKVSLREATARMVESATREVCELGCRIDSLTKDERTRLNTARQCLTWAQQMGLWRDNQTSAPAELAQSHAAEQDRMSAETVLADHPPEAESLTIEPDPDSDSPSPAQVDP